MRKVVPAMLVSMLAFAGCASPGKIGLAPGDAADPGKARVVRPGDVADIRFLCRLQSGEVVAATDKAVGQQEDLPKSAVFRLRDKDVPLAVTATASLPKTPGSKEAAFEEEIINRLTGVIVGMKAGETRTVNLAAEELPERGKDDYLIRVARIRVRPKEMRMPIGDYQARTGKPPEVGQPFIIDPAVQGKVEAVTQEEVVIRFSAQPGSVVPTPFGPGRIRETEKNYEIVIGAREGALVRTGPLVGRITDVDEQFITIDYRNPFGGETLICDVAVEKVSEAKPAKSGTKE